MRRVLLFLMLLASPASANDICDDLWMTRNALFNEAGYCFGSPLGQALFDNSDCTGKTVTLGTAQQAIADEVRRNEALFGCKIDTARRTLDIPDLAIRLQLQDHPIRDEFESGCLGWAGPAQSLVNGHNLNAPQVGVIETGDYVLFSHWESAGWNYVHVYDRDGRNFKSAGWAPSHMFSQSACHSWAG